MLTTDIPKKIRGNAAISYGMMFASLGFLISKNPNLNHPFVKKHTKTAFILHVILLSMLFLMSYSFLGIVVVFNFTINDIITIILACIILGIIIYGATKAYKGETLSFLDIIHTIGIKKIYMETKKINSIEEYSNSLIMFTYIPFLGYALSARYYNNSYLRDINIFNLICICICLVMLFFGMNAMATIIFLAYIIGSLFFVLKLHMSHELMYIKLNFIPTPTELYLYIKALFPYIKNIFDKNTFVPIKELKDKEQYRHNAQEKEKIRILQKLQKFPYSQMFVSLPFINFIGILYLHTYERYRIINGITLSILLIIIIFQFGVQSPVFLMGLIPFAYFIGFYKRKAYHMPYISDIANIVCISLLYTKNFLKKIYGLHKKETSGTYRSQDQL